MPEFVAIDGEAIPDCYNLMCASTGQSLVNMDELTTCECFDFLLSLQAKSRVLVCFGLNYDVNMWLRDLDREALETLWERHECVYVPRGKYRSPESWYKIEWIPGHRFEIKQAGKPRVRVYEVWGFFQASFVSALRAWGIGNDSELTRMERTKAERGSFTTLETTQAYCMQEVRYLVDLMQALSAACREASCEPREYMGAGSLAARLLSDRKDLQRHHKHDADLGPPESVHAILCAYFGGRIELLRQGIFYRVKTLDVKSAYPYGITQLPSLYNGELKHVTRYQPNAKHAIWRVRWPIQRGYLMPFPVRHKKDVYYPVSGEGWYHACEIEAARLLGYDCKVLEGWVLNAPLQVTPFGWVPELFDIRARWKQEGKAAEKVLKIGLNSLYGKLAQGIGFHNRLPRWQSYFWAGEITARTRARMLIAAHRVGDNAIMITTDGLFHNSDVEVADVQTVVASDTGLGAWEADAYDTVFAARAGVYMAQNNGDEPLIKSRGFYAKEVDFNELQECYERDGAMGRYSYTARRFIGIGTALHRRDFSVWRTWETDPDRVVSLMPLAKRLTRDDRLLPYDEVLPPSEAYEPKTSIVTDEDRIQADEQPDKIGGLT